MQESKLLPIKEYREKMEVKYKGLKVINDKLLMSDSFSRGHLLYTLLYDMALPINPELKYYIFFNWWSSIDSYHDKFEAKDIRKWIREAKIDLQSDLANQLEFDNNGHVTVYRGINEKADQYGLSWTTDIEVALL